ncbi:hypothetical protein HK107_07980 [Parvularcula sp. ZS-1/3]|uniref:Uncharacterized protein n=1 Tax=Parvularcula mediterranea TaxID=2732508 RepID=A0A7Y3RMZ9_9PROT|nr:hypothetical protein [Parvularcula mediterranea]NNU16257.1 hypothetical protein [Parvularcula mediterranea]
MRLFERIFGTKDYRLRLTEELRGHPLRLIAPFISLAFFVGLGGAMLFDMTEVFQHWVDDAYQLILRKTFLWLFVVGLSLLSTYMALSMRIIWRVKNEFHGRPSWARRAFRRLGLSYALAIPAVIVGSILTSVIRGEEVFPHPDPYRNEYGSHSSVD